MKVLGIHGIGNHRPGVTPEVAAEQLGAIWKASLEESLPGKELDVAVVYYSDLVQPPGHQGDDDSLDDLSPEELLIVETLLQPQELVPAGVAQGRLTARLRATLSDFAKRHECTEWLMEWLMVRFAKEVASYLGDTEARNATRARVLAAIEEHRPDVFIAHSLGTVVSYEALHARLTPRIPLWVTLGSPLAIPKVVFDRLEPRAVANHGRKPRSVERWANLADHGDLVAIPINGVYQRFTGVDSNHHDAIHAFDFHRVQNYLRCERLRRLLA